MSDLSTVVIIAGGQIRDMAFLRARVEGVSPKAIICADGGARHAQAAGLVPHLVIGDMDSIAPDVLQALSVQGTHTRRYPAKKDETDAELAFDAACELYPEQILVFGALGYRLDHTLANLSLLLKGLARGIPVKLLDEWSEVFLVEGACTIDGEIGQTVSLLPFGTAVTGITLSGFQYPLVKGTMSPDRPLGISNRLTQTKGQITLASGRLLVIRYLREGAFPS